MANKDKGINIVFPRSVVLESNKRYSNKIFGYFLGNRLPFPVVDRYVGNVWKKFGLEKVMMNSWGFFYFKFTSMEGMVKVLEGGPWMIRNIYIIIKKWSPDIGMVKLDITKIHVWIKLHDIPLVCYTDDGLSAIATKLVKPLMVDSYTSNMCVKAWGRPSFARAMIEVSSDSELKDKIVVVIPKLESIGYTKCDIKVEYEWKPPICAGCKVFGYDESNCTKKTSKQVSKEKKVVDDDGFQQVKAKKNNKNNKSFHLGPRVEYRPKQSTKDPGPSDPSKNSFGPLNDEKSDHGVRTDGNGNATTAKEKVNENIKPKEHAEVVNNEGVCRHSEDSKQQDGNDIDSVDGEENFMKNHDKTIGASTSAATGLEV